MVGNYPLIPKRLHVSRKKPCICSHTFPFLLFPAPSSHQSAEDTEWQSPGQASCSLLSLALPAPGLPFVGTLRWHPSDFHTVD